MVPHDTDLDLETHNGGIAISDVRGRIRFDALNGGVHLRGTGGDVEGHTTNGGLNVDLDGDRWNGSGLDVRTTNGGVTIHVPRGYSARLETGTVNGGISLDFPVTVPGRIGRSLDIELGEGGATVRAMTTNGGVRIVRSGVRQSGQTAPPGRSDGVLTGREEAGDRSTPTRELPGACPHPTPR